MMCRRKELPKLDKAALERGTTALMAAEAANQLTNIYGRVDRRQARSHAQAVLEAALGLREEDIYETEKSND